MPTTTTKKLGFFEIERPVSLWPVIAQKQRVLKDYRWPGFLAVAYDMAQRHPHSPSPVGKLHRRHIGRLRKSDNLLTGGGGGGGEEPKKENLVLYKSFNTLCSDTVLHQILEKIAEWEISYYSQARFTKKSMIVGKRQKFCNLLTVSQCILVVYLVIITHYLSFIHMFSLRFLILHK